MFDHPPPPASAGVLTSFYTFLFTFQMQFFSPSAFQPANHSSVCALLSPSVLFACILFYLFIHFIFNVQFGNIEIQYHIPFFTPQEEVCLFL